MINLYGNETEQPVEEPIESAKMSPFDIIKNINKKDILLSSDVIEDNYIPFIINKALSNTKSSIFFANEMNRCINNLSKVMQYDFYYYALPKDAKRWGEWNKKESDDTIDIIKEYYGYSEAKAKAVLPILLTDEGYLKSIKDSLNRGGGVNSDATRKRK